jgi:integral membrane protein
MESKIRNLRIIGISEGASFLVLLLIAMPLKYGLGITTPVKLIGWIHGVLFIAYVITVFLSIRAMRWGFVGVVIALAASLLPLGTFLLDKQLKRRQEEIRLERQ